jgi:hypothetical protein
VQCSIDKIKKTLYHRLLTCYLDEFTAGAAALAAASAAVAGIVLAATCTMLRAAKCPKLESRESVMMF